MTRLRKRWHYLWFQAQTDWVELFSAALSGSFVPVLVYRGNSSILGVALPFALLCLMASLCKVVGVTWEVYPLRVAGCALGTAFWTMLSLTLWKNSGLSVSFGCFAVMAGIQVWVNWRLRRHHKMTQLVRRAV